MGMFDWIGFEKGQARFCGSQRAADGSGQDLFAAQLAGHSIYYGEFVTKYAEDKTHYNVEVLSFGFPSETQAGTRLAPARQVFLSSEIEDLRSVISALFLADEEKPSPVHLPERFLGRTLFRGDWVRERQLLA